MKRKNKLGICSVLVLTVGLLCGCAAKEGATGKEEGQFESKVVIEEREQMQDIKLTEEEEKLLCEVYINEDRIKEGVLLDYQVECLEQIRLAKQYLEQKYPETAFEIIQIAPMSKINTITEVSFVANSDDTVYNMQITKENDEYQAADNYYGVLIREAYDEYLTEQLKKKGFSTGITYTKFSHVYGAEIDGRLTVEKILELDKDLSRNTGIFVEGAKQEAGSISKEIEDYVRSLGIYGSYTVYVIEDMTNVGQTGDALSDYVSNTREGIEVTYFNCFD